MTDRKNKQEKKKEMKKEILSWIFTFVAAIIAALMIVTFVGQRVKVDGHSMETTLQDADNLICDKLSYRFHNPERYDIVVIFPDETKSKRWIKRVIGLPGEIIQIDDKGNIFINGKVLDDNYGREIIKDPGLAAQEITLGENEYWVMGDNRNHSSDSRVIGPIPKSQIIGKAILRIYPFSKIGITW